MPRVERRKHITVYLNPYLDISKYLEEGKIVRVYEKKDMIGSGDEMESKIFHEIYDIFPDNTDFGIHLFYYYPKYINGRFRYSRFGWKVKISFKSLMDAMDVRAKILAVGEKYDIRTIMDVYEIEFVEKLIKKGE